LQLLNTFNHDVVLEMLTICKIYQVVAKFNGFRIIDGRQFVFRAGNKHVFLKYIKYTIEE